jgi:hypothetical protein
VKLNLYKVLEVLRDVRDYVLPIQSITKKFKSIKSEEQLKNYIKERSAHVVQTTLYGYVKTRIGSRYAMMFEDEVFSKSINIAKWNIYMSAISDFTLFTFSYLVDLKNLTKKNNAEKVFNSIIEEEKKNGLDYELSESSKVNFKDRVDKVNWNTYHKEKPFDNSANALYHWSPIAEELKILDKEIVLNSIKLKWNLVENEFKILTKNFNFN